MQIWRADSHRRTFATQEKSARSSWAIAIAAPAFGPHPAAVRVGQFAAAIAKTAPRT
jgi:hypothetical protein